MIGVVINGCLFFFGGVIWFWLWAVAAVLVLSSMAGEW